MELPRGASLVGIKIIDNAIKPPSFGHPPRAVHVPGAKRKSLSRSLAKRRDYVARIPAQFSINMATADAIVMYDRTRTPGPFAERLTTAGCPTQPLKTGVHGKSKVRAGLATLDNEDAR